MMKKIIYTLLAMLLLTAGASASPPGTILSIGSSGLSITSGTVFSVQGLVLTPSGDVFINSNSITISATAVTNGSDQSIDRVYSFASPLSSYSGSLGIQYSSGELNGNTESALQIAYNPLSSGGSFVVTGGSNTGSPGSYYVSNTLSSVNLGRVTALPIPCPTSVHLYRAGSLLNDYCTIQAAVDASQDGDSIQVDAGTYVEQVTITTGITLRGAGRDVTIIQSPDKNSLVITGGDWKNLKNQDIYDVVGIKATNDVPVVIKDLRVDGNDQGYFPLAPNINGYDFQGIGVFNTTVVIDNVYVTRVRGLASEQLFFPPAGYPEDQPLGYNHNDAIFAESSAEAGSHTFTLTNSYITKFQKTAILAWGPTLTVDINNNTIQGYGKTMWSTGNGIQIASAISAGDRRSTKGSVTNNQILDMGIIVPAPPDPDSYFNPYLGGSTGVLLWEAGDGFVIEGNTITRTDYIPSWNAVTTSNNGGYSNMAIDVVSTTNVVVNNNTIFNFDEGLMVETYIATPNIIANGNIIYNNTHDYWSGSGNDNFSLSDSAEVIAYYASGNGVDTISGFGRGDKLYVNDINVAGCVNGLIGGVPTVDFTGGTVTEGNGTNVPAHSVQVEKTGTQTYLYIDTDSNAGQAELVVILNGVYETINFVLDGAYIKYRVTTPPTVSITSPADGITVYGNPLTVNGTAADADGNLSLVEVRLNGGSWETATGTDTWTININLDPGLNTIEVRAKDDTGLSSDTATIKVLLSIQIIDIPQGWSAISSYLTPLNPVLPVMMDEITNNDNLVIMLSEYGIYWPPYNTNTIGNWNVEKGYKVKMNQAQEFTVVGDTLLNRTINLSQGYHIVPVLSNAACPIASIFSNPLNDIMFMFDVKTNELYWPQGGISTLTSLEPGKGYIASFNKAVTITYPAYSGLKSAIMNDITEPELEGPWPVVRTADVHFVSIKSDAVSKIENALYIGAFDSFGNCIGYTFIDGRNGNYLLSIYGNDVSTDVKDGADEDEPISFRCFNANTGLETFLIPEFSSQFPNKDGLFSTNGQSQIIRFKESATGTHNTGIADRVQIFPNPAKEMVNIIYPFDETTVTLTLISADGKTMETKTLSNNETQLEVSNLKPGIYILKFESMESTVIKRLVIQ